MAGCVGPVAGIVAGTVVANLARHHERAFHEIENVEWPFMLMFFLFAGATLEVHRLPELGLIGLGYVVLRILRASSAAGSARAWPACPGRKGTGSAPRFCLRRAWRWAWRWWRGRRSPTGATRS
jgi:hypothetical protein